jgi:predicted neuraminidase
MASEFIYESARFPSCHASTILETSPGVFLAAWFGGTAEGDKDVTIWLARRNGSAWTKPERIAEEKGQPCWNPVLFGERKSGDVLLFYKAGPSPQTWSGFYKRSRDGGQTFGESFILASGLLGPIKNKAVQLDDGTILAPTSTESYKTWAAWVERSTDGGRSWTKHGPVFHPEQPYGVIQPSILFRRDGSLMMVMRSRGIGQVCMATSKDQGLSWTSATAIAALPNPNSGIDAVTLADGRQALVYNPTHQGRTPLALALSSDDGQTWKTVRTLEDDPGEYSYPAVIQASDGTVHITYTWKRQRIRHQWFRLDELTA